MSASGRQAGQPPEPLLRVGRYVLFDEIAAGGMASVHYGRMFGGSGFSKTVAVKRLHAQFAKDPEFRGMFLDEARLAARIRHTNVVQPVDILASETELFVALEYVHGDSLAGLLGAAARREELPHPAIASTVVAGLLHGLHAAHEAKDDRGTPLGLVHRDISPHNVLVGTDGVPRVIDFGVAKATNRVQSTQDGQLKGKVAYMCPEQLAGEPIGPAADIWAAGVVLWEFLAGRRLHEGLEPVAIFGRVTRGDLPQLATVNPHVPPELVAIVGRALERDVRVRYQTAREMALDIESYTAFAPPSAVAAWVDHLVGDKLRLRADRLEAIERVNLESEFEVEEIELAPMTSLPRSFPGSNGTDSKISQSGLRRGPPGSGSQSGRTNPTLPSQAGVQGLPPPAPRMPSLVPSARTLPSATPLGELDTSSLQLDSDTPEQVPAARPSRMGMSGEFGTTNPDGSGGFHASSGYVTGVPQSRRGDPSSRAVPPSDLKRPDVVLADVRWADPTAAKTTTPSSATSRWKPLVLIALTVAALFGLGFYGLPRYVQAQAEGEIASLGFQAKSQESTVALGTIRFRNVELTPLGVEGVTLRMSSIVVRLDGSRPTDATISDLVIEGDGAASDLLPKLAIWYRKYGENWGKTGLSELRVDGGRLDWRSIVGPGSRLEIARLSGTSTATEGETLLNSADVSLGLFRLTTGGAPAIPGTPAKADQTRNFGPWRGRYHPANGHPMFELMFGQKATAPELTIAPSGDALAFTVAIPRTTVEELAFPSDFLAGVTTPQTQISATGAVLISNAGLRGQGRFGFFGTKVVGLPASDGSLDFVLDGKGGAQGTFAFGADKDGHPIKTPITGTASRTPTGPSFEISARSAPRACEKGGGETTVDATVVFGDQALVRLAPTTLCKVH